MKKIIIHLLAIASLLFMYNAVLAQNLVTSKTTNNINQSSTSMNATIDNNSSIAKFSNFKRYDYDFKIGQIRYKFTNDRTAVGITCDSPYDWDNQNYKDYMPSGNIVIDEEVEYQGKKYKVVSLCVRAFANCKDLKHITLPKGLRAIDKYAFQNCSALEEIDIPAKVRFLGEKAFINCTNLKKFTLPKLINIIPFKCFENCGIEELTLPYNIGIIGKEAFIGCKKLKKINFSSTTHTIGKYAFKHCEQLKEFKLPKHLAVIDTGAFAYCTAIETVDLRETNPVYHNGTFEFCSGIKEVKFRTESDFTEVPFGMFRACTSLEKIEIPENIKEIRGDAFFRCYKLKDIKFSSNLLGIHISAFRSCKSLERINFPESIRVIWDKAFEDCRKLRYLKLPKSIKILNPYAFGECSALDTVEVFWDNPISIKDNVFNYLEPSEIVLIVPFGTKEKYQNAPVWQEFMIEEKAKSSVLEELEEISINTNANILHISRINKNLANTNIMIFDSMGKLIATHNNADDFSISLPSGVYFIQYGDKSKKILIY